MKRTNLIPVALLAALMLTAFTNAQDVTGTFPENGVKTLIKGIKSGNEGLSRSSIYFAGKYKITDAIDALVDKMQKEKRPDTRILIALSLYEIGDIKGLQAVKEQAINDSDERVKRMSTLIFDEFYKNYTGDYKFLEYFVAKSHSK